MFVALDLATNTGWAGWRPGLERPIYGSWRLPGEPGEVGRKCVALHRRLADLHQLEPIERIYFEAAINPDSLSGFTNIQTIKLAQGLCSHAESFAYAVNARCREVPNTAWKKHFIGRGIRRGTNLSAGEFKKLSIVRCQEMGLAPPDNDCADALGVLDYAIHLSEIVPPWRDAHLLRRELA